MACRNAGYRCFSGSWFSAPAKSTPLVAKLKAIVSTISWDAANSGRDTTACQAWEGFWLAKSLTSNLSRASMTSLLTRPNSARVQKPPLSNVRNSDAASLSTACLSASRLPIPSFTRHRLDKTSVRAALFLGSNLINCVKRRGTLGVCVECVTLLGALTESAAFLTGDSEGTLSRRSNGEFSGASIPAPAPANTEISQHNAVFTILKRKWDSKSPLPVGRKQPSTSKIKHQ